jgi:tape measure domain-containing protein
MATTDVERLVVSLDASITKYERAMQKAVAATNSSMQKIERRNASMIQRVHSGFSGLQRGIATAFAGAAALRGAQQLIDASTRIENSLKVAGLAGEDLTQVYDALFESAQRNAAPLESLVSLYGRATLVQNELGASTEELLGFTDNVALALRVAGTDAQTASGALLQLSQALGSGVVRAEEFNSIQEGALPVLQAVAAGLEEAGGSVAKLRGLVIDGKVSSEAFFRAFEAGSVVLREKVAGSELTVSQGFVRLQNVLIDAAGKFDTATNASARFAGFLQDVANKIEGAGRAADANAPAINRFLDWFLTAGDDLGNSMLGGLNRDLESVAGAVDAISAAVDRYGSSVTDAELATAQAEQALAAFALNSSGQFGELDAVVQDFIQQLLEGRGTAESAAEAINAIGEAGDFGGLLGKLSGLVDGLFAVRSEAVATAAAVAATARGDTARGNIADQRAEQQADRPAPAVKPVSLSDYVPPGSGSGGGKSGADRFADAVASQQQRIDALTRETELQRELGVALNDYGFAMERLRAQVELENAAKEAGLPLDEKRMQQIDDLATGYGRATAEAARLAEAQDMARQTAEDLANAGRQALDTIIDGFIEGKDAGEIFNSVLKDLGKNLLNMGLNAVFGGSGGGGLGSLLGGLLGKGFAAGTSNTGGMRGEPRGVVHGQEAVIPLPNGGKVPVDVRLPSIPSTAAQAAVGGQTNIFHIDAKGAEIGVEEKIVGAIQAMVPGMIKQSAPGALAQYQQQRQGSDYR